MKKLLIAIVILSVVEGWTNNVEAQETGIQWTTGLSWDQIKQKAKAENKYIFIDAYTTWCGPCKMMDKEVYPSIEVGKAINQKFISVKIQMDKTEKDEEQIKRLYNDARKIKADYSIVAFPAYLFFSPDGQPVHKAAGFKNQGEFIALISDVFNPDKQFYAILNNFQPGKMDTSEMKGLARAFSNSGTTLSERIAADYLKRIPKNELSTPDNLSFMAQFQQSDQVLEIVKTYLNSLEKKEFASALNLSFLTWLREKSAVEEIVAKYIKSLNKEEFNTEENMAVISRFKEIPQIASMAIDYLNTLGDNKLYSKKMIPFIAQFVKSPDDQFFNLFFKHTAKVNKVMGKKDYSQSVVDRVVINNEVNSVILSSKEEEVPDFDKMNKKIIAKYGIEYADRNVLRGKVAFYNYQTKKYNSNWDEYVKYNFEFIDKYGDTTTSYSALELNNFLFEAMFMHCNDKAKLNKGVKWMEGVIRRDSGKIVTYFDTYANLLYKVGRREEAIIIQERACLLNPEDKSFKDNLEKMKRNEPTWPISIRKKGKSVIDFNAIDNWQGISSYLSVNGNGKYFAYGIERGSGLPDEYKKLDSLVVQSTTDSWRRAFTETKPGFFAADNRQYVFHEKDNLFFLQLGTEKVNVIKNVESYKTIGVRNNWVAYQLVTDDKTVVLQNFLKGEERQFKNVLSYAFDNSKQWFLVQLKTPSKGLLIYNLKSGKEQTFSSVKSHIFSQGGKKLLINIGNELQYVNFTEQTVKAIWVAKDSSKVLSAYQFDVSEKQVVFTVKDVSGDKQINSIWYYKEGMSQAIVKVDKQTSGLVSDVQIKTASFTDNGQYIQFTFNRKQKIINSASDAVQLEVWSHNDSMLQSKQSYLLLEQKVMNAIVNVQSDKVLLLNKEDQAVQLLHGDFAIVRQLKEARGDRFWENDNEHKPDSSWVVSLRDGSRRLLLTNSKRPSFWFSPNNNYLIYFDGKYAGHFFSYELSTGKIEDISANVADGQLQYIDRHYGSEKSEQPWGLAAWLQGGAGLLVYDNNDIWKLNITGNKPAVNITRGYGRSHNIIFRLSQTLTSIIPTLNDNEPLLLTAFNVKNKYSGFYRKNIDSSGDPQLLYMGSYFMNLVYTWHDLNLSNRGMRQVKAPDVASWIVQRQSVTDAPNYYETKDFKSFKRLTDIQPQKSFNWLSQELHSFKHLDGKIGQGILYKPENFDSTKKYPVLVIFYGVYSNNLHQYPAPAYNENTMTPGTSPAWFLNNGYLVFTPDIYVTALRYGPDAYNVIEGAAKYLNQQPYVDSNSLGLGAHSWSAKLCSYIFTHSKAFRAFAITEGLVYANMINVALSLDDKGGSQLELIEKDFKFGNLWQNKESWLDQTTVLNVDKVGSPLLLLCNKQSSEEYQNQTLQLFIALRRLEKKVWWLKYDKGGHNLYELMEQKDYTIRYAQFFNHYLKSAPAPIWMSRGIPARLKSIQTGYPLDPTGTCSPTCKVCKTWNDKFKKDSVATLKEIETRKVEEHWE